MQTKKLTAFNS